MGVLCFVVDLPTLPPPLLEDVKQCLLRLANYYAVSSFSSDYLRDRIALCYLVSSPSPELKIAYRPNERGDFCLRDFHDAVQNLPTDFFFPDPTYSCDMKLSNLLQDQLLYSWGNDSNAIVRTVVVLTSYLPAGLDADLLKSLQDAADKCISIEFVLFETRSNHLSDLLENNNAFIDSISHLDNCSTRTCLPEARLLDGMAKMWLRDLKDESEEQMRFSFTFKHNLLGSVNQILCNLSIYVSPITDDFSSCQTCRCHGIILSETETTKMGRMCCPITGNDLQSTDLIENSIKVGDKMTLFMPDSSKFMKSRKVSSPVDFNVIERTNLGSLNEGIMVGTPYVVTPAASHEIGEASDEMNESEINNQLFQGVCRVLHSLDQGLVCYSNYNVETMKTALFPCYYIILPSDNRLMLLRRVGGLEEIFPVPDMDKYFSSTVSKEIESSVQNSIMMMDSVDYDPFCHARGFHQKLNSLVKESTPFGYAPAPQEKSPTSDPNKSNIESNTPQKDSRFVDLTEGGGGELEDEWEQLVITDIPSISMGQPHGSTSIAENQTCGKEAAAASEDKTRRILERLEVPGSNCFLHKTIDVAATTNKFIRPNFQRSKRRQK